jgi:hypothetical protein
MCECLLEGCDQAEVRVHTPCKLGVDPVDRDGFVLRAVAGAEVFVELEES